MITENKRLRILITGVSGLIGTALKEFLESRGHEVIGLSLKTVDYSMQVSPRSFSGGSFFGGSGMRTLAALPHVLTEFRKSMGYDEITESSTGKHFLNSYQLMALIKNLNLNDIDAVINLSGETVAQRWSKETKKRIYDSRIFGSSILAQTILEAKNPPKIYISASSAGIYEMSAVSPATESSQLTTKESFLSHVIRDWESATEILDKRGIRRINLRLGSVLSKKGGFLSPMLLSFKTGFGGYQGSGNQLISWIDIDDLIQAIYFCILNETIQGPVNMVSPHPVTNKLFCKALGKALSRPVWLPVPAFLLKLIFGKEFAQELILNDQNVYPKKLLDAGFEFQHPYIEESLNHLLK